MKWYPVIVCLILLVVCSPKRVSGSEQPVIRTASVARVPADNLNAVTDLVKSWKDKASDNREGFYLRNIEGASYLFHYIESDHSNPHAEMLNALSGLVEPLEVAADNDRIFEPMESVFFDRGAADKEPEQEVVRIAMITGLKHEKERDYRLLHDNPWPDVLAAIRKANLRNFSIFLEEIDGKLYLFGWLEYVGSDSDADSAQNKKDPASIRWWKETDACQIAPEDSGDGMWGGLEELVFLGG